MLSRLITSPRSAPPTSLLSDWARRHREATRAQYDPFDAAMLVAVSADRLAWAFASAYQAALRVLVPGLPADRLVALCVTEAGGGHPRAVQTTLTQQAGHTRITGTKRFVTMGPYAELLLVVAREPSDADRPRLRLARLPADREGVRLEEGPAVPFCPEIPHGSAALDEVQAGPLEVSHDDAYTSVVKPFRTVEDILVIAAALAYTIGVGRRFGWPREAIEERLAGVACLRGMAAMSPDAPGVHLALAGVLSLARLHLNPQDPLWDRVEPGERERFARDAALFGVAGAVRAARRERAWQVLESPDGATTR